jgi:hypothetical protein
MLMLKNILQYSIIFSVKFFFVKKIIFLIFRHSIFGIILCRTCYLATVVAKFALTLVQKWPYKNEVIDLCNNFFNKITTLRMSYFKPIPTNLALKRVNILFVIKFKRNFFI